MAHNMDKEERLKAFEILVDELIKSEPEEKLVQQYMAKVNIPYSEDPIGRINSVLAALHFEEPLEESNTRRKPK